MRKFKLIGITFLLLLMPIKVIGSNYNLYAQFLGSTVGYGVGFDSRFKNGSTLGYSIGIAYTNMSFQDNFEKDTDLYEYYKNLIDCNKSVKSEGVTIPLEINAMFGVRNSKLDVGIGIIPFVGYRWHSFSGYDSTGDFEFKRYEDVHKFRVRGLCSASVGYRLQRSTGFFMRLGLTALVGGRSNFSLMNGFYVFPNICLGYTFKKCQ